MKLVNCIGVAAALAAAAFGAPGDTIWWGQIPAAENIVIGGLAHDPGDGKIWAAGPVSGTTYQCRYCKFDPETHQLVKSWAAMASTVGSCFDVGYGYEYGGVRCLVVNDDVDFSPYTKIVDPRDGSQKGNLPDYYSRPSYTAGCAVDWKTNDVFISSNARTLDGGTDDPRVARYDGNEWTVFASVGEANEGLAVGWGHVFLLRMYPFYDIYVFGMEGKLEDTIHLNELPANFVAGLSLGRVDAVGANESLFIGIKASDHSVVEVEVKDYAGVAVAPASVGRIKALYR
jgi:hypothetical protein